MKLRRSSLLIGALAGAGLLSLASCSSRSSEPLAGTSPVTEASAPRRQEAPAEFEAQAESEADDAAQASELADRKRGPQGVPADKAPEQGTRGQMVGGLLGGTAGGAPAADVSPAPAKPTPTAPESKAAARGDVAQVSKEKLESRRSRHAPAAPPPPPMALAVEGGKGAKKDAPAPEPIRSTDTFQRHEPNPWVQTAEDRLSTFAVDVDTASYTVARRMIENDGLPHPASVRVEEFVNYFKYEYPQPERGAFSVNLEGAPSPFGKGKTILKVGLQGRQVAKSQRKPAHLVFLVDTSGSMNSPDKLPMALEALKLLVKNLNENDTVALVTYAGSTRDVLPPTPASDHARIFRAIDSLSAGGGTAMGSGIKMAYAHAMKNVGNGKIARVIVLTDGDTNLGPNLTADAMLESVKGAVAEGVTLSTIGLGMGNYRDDLMERLANRGNGNAFYIDSFREARKVFQTQLTGTLEVIAKDVKIQVEFDPATVRSYRLLGYENRDIADRDFRNDRVDAGEIGAGHSVTALYEVELTEAPGPLATVRVRAKAPNGSKAEEQQFQFGRDRLARSLDAASDDLRFAVSVAGTADVLRQSNASETWSLATALKLARGSSKGIPEREEFVRLLQRAHELSVQQRGMARGR